MKRMQLWMVLGLFFCLCLVVPASSQTDLETTLKQYNSETVKGYIQPLADMFGANMQAGFYHSAAIPSSGFHFSLQIIGMGSLLDDSQREFTAPTPSGWNPASFKTATIFGGKGTEVTNAAAPGLKYRGSDGIFNTKFVPLAAPQITIGSVFGTEASFRFVPIPKMSEGKFPSGSLWGVGLRHSISQYIDNSPLDIAVGGFMSSFTFGDLIDFKGYSFGVQASKEFSILILYGGVNYEKSDMNLKYTTTDPNAQPLVNINLGGANNFRATVGAGLSLWIIHLFADANFGSVTNFSAGIGFGG
jgi:hypothetical protein